MHSYILPTIVSLPLGYDVDIPLVENDIIARLAVSDTTIKVRFVVCRAGGEVLNTERLLRVENRKLVSGSVLPLEWRDPKDQAEHAYAEVHFESVHGAKIFANNTPFSIYAVYSAPGKKSFFSDNSYKYGSPPIIDQMAMFGQFVETMTVINLDRGRDLGETLVFINPYKRAINVQVFASDGRSLPKFQVPPVSCKHVALAPIMADDPSWRGHIQMTANNRLVAFHTKHSLRDPRVISDHEHLDPFRADDTHWPLTLLLRTVPLRMAGAAKRLLARSA